MGHFWTKSSAFFGRKLKASHTNYSWGFQLAIVSRAQGWRSGMVSTINKRANTPLLGGELPTGK